MFLTLILWLGIDVDAERFMTDGLHAFFITITRIVVEIKRKLCTVLDRSGTEGYCLANIHNTIRLKLNIRG